MKRLIEIIDKLREIIKQQDMNISDDVLFTQASSFLRGEIASERFKVFPKQEQKFYPKQEEPRKLNPMSEAQEKFIKVNDKKLREKGFDIDNIQSKGDAFKIIKAFKEMK